MTYPELIWNIPLQNNEYIQSVARCLQMMLRINEYRLEFVRLDGIGAIVSVLSGRINFQIQYQVGSVSLNVAFPVNKRDLTDRNKIVL